MVSRSSLESAVTRGIHCHPRNLHITMRSGGCSSSVPKDRAVWKCPNLSVAWEGGPRPASGTGGEVLWVVPPAGPHLSSLAPHPLQ